MENEEKNNFFINAKMSEKFSKKQKIQGWNNK